MATHTEKQQGFGPGHVHGQHSLIDFVGQESVVAAVAFVGACMAAKRC